MSDVNNDFKRSVILIPQPFSKFESKSGRTRHQLTPAVGESTQLYLSFIIDGTFQNKLLEFLQLSHHYTEKVINDMPVDILPIF